MQNYQNKARRNSDEEEMTDVIDMKITGTRIETQKGARSIRTEANTKADNSSKQMQHLGDAIDELLEMLEDKQQRTVNNTTRGLARKVKHAFNSLRRAQIEEKTKIKPATVHNRTQELAGAKKELFGTPVGKLLPTETFITPKRKAKSPPIPEGEREKKRVNHQKVAPVTQNPERVQEPAQHGRDKAEEGWKSVKKKKKEKKREKHRKNGETAKRGSRIRPAALLISTKEGSSYADILRKVKQTMPQDVVENNFEKVRRTASGQLLIVLNRKIGNEMGSIQKKVEVALEGEAAVTGKTHEVNMLVRDMEETTTKEEVRAGIQKVADKDFDVKVDVIKSMRKGYGETQTAQVRLPVEIARKIIGERGRIRIGLVNCRVKEVDLPLRCFKCWNIGHIANQCKSEVDRSALCIKCGGSGHKIAECKKEAFCVLCRETKEEEQCKHIAGSYKCAANEANNKKTALKRR